MATIVNTLFAHVGSTISTVISISFIPWHITYKSLHSLLNNPSQQDERLTVWRQEKLGELNNVGLTCAVVAAAIAGALSWPQQDGLPWLTSALWVGSIFMSLTALSSASQQTLLLHRLHCYKDVTERLKNMLGKQSKQDTNKWSVRPVQLFVWQIPAMMLNFAIVAFLSGLIVLLVDRARAQSWDMMAADTKICVVAGFIAIFSLSNYLIGITCLYSQTYQGSQI